MAELMEDVVSKIEELAAEVAILSNTIGELAEKLRDEMNAEIEGGKGVDYKPQKEELMMAQFRNINDVAKMLYGRKL